MTRPGAQPGMQSRRARTPRPVLAAHAPSLTRALAFIPVDRGLGGHGSPAGTPLCPSPRERQWAVCGVWGCRHSI